MENAWILEVEKHVLKLLEMKSGRDSTYVLSQSSRFVVFVFQPDLFRRFCRSGVDVHGVLALQRTGPMLIEFCFKAIFRSGGLDAVSMYFVLWSICLRSMLQNC